MKKKKKEIPSDFGFISIDLDKESLLEILNI